MSRSYVRTPAELRNGPAAVERAVPVVDPARSAARRSWVVLCAAFLNWCLLAGVAVGFGLHYRATATDPQQAGITVDRGLVSYQPASGSEPRLITRERIEVLDGTVVQTGPNSQAAIELFDGSRLRLLPDAAIGLDVMQSGRFEPASTRLQLQLQAGPALLRVPGSLPSGPAVVQLGEAVAYLYEGQFLVWMEPNAARLSVYEGQATLVEGDKEIWLATGERAVVRRSTGLSDALPLGEDLLVNGDFSLDFVGWANVDELEVGNDALGQRELIPVDIDRQETIALRVSRETAQERHNKTGVVQEINRNVQGFRSLKLRARVQVTSAKLDGGGYAGTEYPMTFVVYYNDEKGGEPNWIHGFYYKNEESRRVDFGQWVPQGEWVEYEVDLMNQPDRPAFIRSLWLFGAGHDFDAMVADVQLIAE